MGGNLREFAFRRRKRSSLGKYLDLESFSKNEQTFEIHFVSMIPVKFVYEGGEETVVYHTALLCLPRLEEAVTLRMLDPEGAAYLELTEDWIVSSISHVIDNGVIYEKGDDVIESNRLIFPAAHHQVVIGLSPSEDLDLAQMTQ